MPVRMLLLVAALLGMAFAPAPKPKERKKPREALQGTWELTSVEWVGVKKGPSPTISKVRIQDERWFTLFKGTNANRQERTSAFAIKLDAAKSPMHLDLTPRGSGPVLVGILKVEGDTATFGYAFDQEGKAERPTSFDKMARGQIVMTFKRIGR